MENIDEIEKQEKEHDTSSLLTQLYTHNRVDWLGKLSFCFTIRYKGLQSRWTDENRTKKSFIDWKLQLKMQPT